MTSRVIDLDRGRAEGGATFLELGGAPMSCYVVGVLRDVDLNADIVEYLRTIDDTLTPYDGRFLVHGTRAEVLEGEWDADLVVIEFPDADRARAWYGSAAYRPLIPLRARNSSGQVLLVEGCAPGYRATEFLAKVIA